MKHYTVSHNILASNVSMGLKDLLYQIFLWEPNLSQYIRDQYKIFSWFFKMGLSFLVCE